MTEVIHDDRGWHVKVGPFETLADAAQFVAVVDSVREMPQPEELPALNVHVSDTIDVVMRANQ